MFVLSFLSFLNQVKILRNVCNEILFVFKALLVLKYESLNTHDVISMYNHTSNRIWLKKRLTQSTSLKIKWPEKKFWAPNLGTHTGKPASKNLRICLWENKLNSICTTWKWRKTMFGRSIKNLSNIQLEHLQPIKGTIVDVTTAFKTTGVINANNSLI